MGFRRWQPWNPTVKVELKKILDPTSLYATKAPSIKLPKLNEFVGYDLIKRAWVVPHGLGLRSDILFKLVKKRANSTRDYHIVFTIAFPNELDGIRLVKSDRKDGSELKLPHHAPTTGYDKQLLIERERKPGVIYDASKQIAKENDHYFMRLRSEVDKNGELESAIYAKTSGPFSIGSFIDEPTGKTSFEYYLNPRTNDTNLEFDPNQNLFPESVSRDRKTRATRP